MKKVKSKILSVFCCTILFLTYGAAMDKGLFIYSHNINSNRFAILDETDKVAFLYLTDKGNQKPIRDAIAYMRITPPEQVDLAQIVMDDEPPILTLNIASKNAVLENTQENQFIFIWSKDGESVALLYNENPIALVSLNEKIGYSKSVIKENKITKPWNQNIYDSLFLKQ